LSLRVTQTFFIYVFLFAPSGEFFLFHVSARHPPNKAPHDNSSSRFSCVLSLPFLSPSLFRPPSASPGSPDHTPHPFTRLQTFTALFTSPFKTLPHLRPSNTPPTLRATPRRPALRPPSGGFPFDPPVWLLSNFSGRTLPICFLSTNGVVPESVAPGPSSFAKYLESLFLGVPWFPGFPPSSPRGAPLVYPQAAPAFTPPPSVLGPARFFRCSDFVLDTGCHRFLYLLCSLCPLVCFSPPTCLDFTSPPPQRKRSRETRSVWTSPTWLPLWHPRHFSPITPPPGLSHSLSIPPFILPGWCSTVTWDKRPCWPPIGPAPHFFAVSLFPGHFASLNLLFAPLLFATLLATSFLFFFFF